MTKFKFKNKNYYLFVEYEIRTNSRGFSPSTWRRFIISGNSSVTVLIRAILFMFNVDWGHLDDLYNPTGYKLILSYDYGDGWEFEVNIKKVDNYAPAPKYPCILSGKGLGIIDDIGRVGNLQDYYDTFEDQLDPDLIAWTGREKIDLDELDKDGLNDGLMHLDD